MNYGLSPGLTLYKRFPAGLHFFDMLYEACHRPGIIVAQYDIRSFPDRRLRIRDSRAKVCGLYHREVVHEIPRRDGKPVRRAYRLNKLLVARRLVDTLRETLEEHRRGPHPVNSAELRRTLDVMLKRVHFLRRGGEQYLQPAVLWDILEFAPVSLDILKIKVPLLGVVQERNVHHVAAQNFYADIGIALCDALYDVRRAAAVSEEAKNQYATLKDEIDKTSSGIEEFFTLGLTQEFDESLPQALAKRNEVYGKKIPALKEQAAAIYVGDLKYQINDLYNQVIDIYNQSKEKSNAYRDKFVEFPKRLAKIKTDYNLDDDKLVNQLKQDIENYLLAIDGANSDPAKEYIAVQNSTDAEELEKFLEKIKTTKEDIIKDSGSLDESIKRLLDYTAESVGLEEQSYRERVKAAEMAKKVQENIGKISASTGKNKSIVRDIEDIEKSEKLKNEEPFKVLDFSKEKSYSGISKSGGTVKTENKPAAEKPAKEGIVRKASGSISKASGVVIKL